MFDYLLFGILTVVGMFLLIWSGKGQKGLESTSKLTGYLSLIRQQLELVTICKAGIKFLIIG